MYIEIWKEIPGWEGEYQVSTEGRVRKLNRKSKRGILKGSTNSKGYEQVSINNKQYLIHRLVAQAFIPNPNNLPYVNHKDENTSNNAVWNLEWCDQKYNMNYGTCLQKRSESMKKAWTDSNSKLNNSLNKKIICIETGQIFDSINEASNWAKCSRINISNCLRGEQKTAMGYHWQYCNDKDFKKYHKGTRIVCYKDGKLIKIFDKLLDAAEWAGCSSANICKCLKGRSNEAKGYTWKYYKEQD